MIDTKLLRDDADGLRAAQQRRGESTELVDALISADERRRVAIANFEAVRAEQKQIGKQIAEADGDYKQELLARSKELSERVKDAEAAQHRSEEEFTALMKTLPNPVLPEVSAGGEDDFTVLDTAGEPRDFAAEGFEPRDHIELGEILGAIDIERGAKVSGSGFYYLTGVGAQLELALTQLAMSKGMEWGLTPVIPPALVKPHAMDGTGFLGQAAENIYHLPRDDMYLVGTSEVPLAAYRSEEILNPETLPLRYVAFSPCFRREAGSHGKDARGIFRVHWFDKVEMFIYCDVDSSYAEHERLLGWERDWLNALEIPYRVTDLAAGDLSLAAARTFDCEAWIPSQQRFREVSSTSNCTSFQARRFDTRIRATDRTVPAATLNGTLCAMTRTIIALLENGQQADGSVRLPKVLHPWLGETLAPLDGR